jgi:uncharacterized membrane protein
MAQGKKVYLSKTLWVNLIALVALLAQSFAGFVIDLEAQAAILAAVNVALRLVTKEPVTWSDDEPAAPKAG